MRMKATSVRLEDEGRTRLGIDQRRGDRLENGDGGVGVLAGAGHQLDLHRRRLADDGHQAAANAQLLLDRLRQNRRRPRQDDDVVRRIERPAVSAVAEIVNCAPAATAVVLSKPTVVPMIVLGSTWAAWARLGSGAKPARSASCGRPSDCPGRSAPCGV